ncbi:hypothetical protein B6V74_12890 [Thioclava sp. F42-5]|uniref:hypothetical protein n=1 Tax=Thioclava sp. F42-5 TaxID=1973005 RepID=UPI000B539A19|nr:hypothetical protein [Thioclava sp. F42-5]OWY08716.1 hypothetical protein B6V74_12890 [Thioclava sp. F42-5]
MCNCSQLGIETLLVEEVAAILSDYCDEEETAYSIEFLDLRVCLPDSIADRVTHRALRACDFAPDTERDGEVWHKPPVGKWRHQHDVDLTHQDYDHLITIASKNIWGYA